MLSSDHIRFENAGRKFWLGAGVRAARLAGGCVSGRDVGEWRLPRRCVCRAGCAQLPWSELVQKRGRFEVDADDEAPAPAFNRSRGSAEGASNVVAGVGILVRDEDSMGRFIISHVKEGYPADTCGRIVAGDEILEVDSRCAGRGPTGS